ncbi:MAG: GlcG/HbpS family heme-binding protein [Anaeromyxobacteraceae bacterium]
MTLSRRALRIAVLTAATFSTASAQTPATAKPAAETPAGARPAAASAAPLTEKNVSMHMALAIIDGVLEQCTKDGYKVSVVIVSNDGVVRASLRGDGTAPHTMEFARRKAYTARTRNMTSLEFMKQTDKPESAYLRQIPEVVGVGGGVPIRVGNTPIGAVGVSGAPGGEKDEVCANAGIARVADQLK